MPVQLSDEEVNRLHEYWSAANYLTAGQIYLKDNPLLERPLTKEDIKPRLLGHWGTTAGLNFIYTHLNRLIRLNDLNMMYIIGPGHGGPGIERSQTGGLQQPDHARWTAQQHCASGFRG